MKPLTQMKCMNFMNVLLNEFKTRITRRPRTEKIETLSVNHTVYLLILQVIEPPVDIGILQLVIILYQVECSLALVVPGFRLGSGFQ